MVFVYANISNEGGLKTQILQPAKTKSNPFKPDAIIINR